MYNKSYQEIRGKKDGCLVNINQQLHFENILTPGHQEYNLDAEGLLYDIYRNPLAVEAECFEHAKKIFGGRYDLIAFLFFIKDDSRFLPISSSNFDASFSLLNIDYKTARQCSWENYQGFINIIREIHSGMQETLPLQGPLRLIDAHSFLWVIRQERFIDWTPSIEQKIQIEQTAEEILQNVISGTGGRRNVTSSTFIRNAKVAEETKRRAGGYCQYCNKPAPFNDKNGIPYLEVHHIIWLSRGGADNTDNTVALCHNCHKRMHIVDKQDDIEKLQQDIYSKDSTIDAKIM